MMSALVGSTVGIVATVGAGATTVGVASGARVDGILVGLAAATPGVAVGATTTLVGAAAGPVVNGPRPMEDLTSLFPLM